MARQRKNKKHPRQSSGISEFQMLEPRLFLSTTVMYRAGGGTGYIDTPFDDCELDYASDTVNNSWNASLSSKSGNQQYGLMAVKNLFTLLPATDANGSALSISSAQLIITRYNTGSSSDTIYVDRMTSNWLINAAGSSESNTTWKHESLSPSQFWAGGGSITTSDYTTTNEGSAAWVNGQCQTDSIDITALVKDMYSASTNYGVIIRTSSTVAFADNYYTSEDGPYNPVLSITYDYIPKVTVTATDSSAAEPNNTGTYTVTRTGTGSALTVNYTVSGTATNGTDYTSLTGSVTIPSGQASATITLTPINDNIVESTETAILTLAAGTGYTVGSPSAATVNIADNDSTVSIVATTNAAEPSTNGLFTVTRAGYTGAAVTVNYSIGGTATNGTDYNTLSGTVTIASGQTTATIPVTVIDDSTVEGTETVLLTLTSGTDYTVGSPNNATVNIADNDSGSFGITGVSGIVNTRQSITISGNAFGSGPDDVFFDDFENGTVGTPINTPGPAVIGNWNGTNNYNTITYSNASHVSGTQSFKGDFSSTSAAACYHQFPANTSQIFATWWVQIPQTMPGLGSADDINWKHVWVLGDLNNVNVDDTIIGFLGVNHDSSNSLGIGHACLPYPQYNISPGWSEGTAYNAGDWIRETYTETGSTGADGYIEWTILDVNTGYKRSSTPYHGQTWANGNPDALNWISFNAYGRQTTGAVGVFDDVYTASGPNANATVEIGNASTYAACTNLSTCPTTGWSGTSITANVNFGSLNTSGSLYLYVTKADGTVSAGYPLTVSAAPLANNDTYTVTSNNVLTVSAPGVIANDIDLQGGTITATKLTNPSHGSVTFNSNGSFTYTPNSNYYGPDSFTYQDSDGTHTGNTATVSISVRQLMVDFNGGGVNVFGSVWTPQWQTVVKGGYMYSSTDGPGGLIGGSTGSGAWASIGGSAQTFSVGQTVFVTWFNDTTTAATFTPQISFTDPDGDGTGTSGTWYNLTPVGMPVGAPVIIGPQLSVTSYYTIDAGSAGSHSLINVCRFSNNLDHMMLDKIELG